MTSSEVITPLLALGARVEELFVQQLDRIAFHGNDEDNSYRVEERRLSALMLDKTVSNERHKEHAEAIIKLADRYKEGFIQPLQRLNDDIQRELVKCEQILRAVPEKSELHAKPLLENVQRWLSLSKELHLARVMASKSIIMQVEVDKRIPTLIIENDGRADTTLSEEQSHQFQKDLAAYAGLMKESFATNQRIQDEREPLVKKVFEREEKSTAEAAPVVPATPQQTVRPINPLEAKPWYRLLKVVYILLWIVAIAFCTFLGFASGSLQTFLISGLIAGLLLVVLRKAFYYIALGRTTAIESPGKGFIDIDDLRDDLAGTLANSPELYQELIAPIFESWKTQYGRRIPIHAVDLLQKRIDVEMNRIKEKKQEIIDKATKKGATLEIAKLGESFERAKAEYKGADRKDFVRELDRLILNLQAQYGTAIPIDEASKLLDKLEADIRQAEGSSHSRE